MKISDKYERLVQWTKTACESLGWSFEAEQKEGSDELTITIDKCPYNIALDDGSLDIHRVNAVVNIPGRYQDEPDTTDEVLICKTKNHPEALMSPLIQSHFKEVRMTWANHAVFNPDDGKEESTLEGA